MMRIRTSGLAVICTALLLSFGVARAGPQVVLTSRDGTTEIRGELRKYDGETYTVRTSLGIISVPAAQVTCAGEGCPIQLVYGGNFAIQGSNTIGKGMLPRLLEGYADSVGAELVVQVGGGKNERVYRLNDSAGKEVTAITVGSRGSVTGLAALADGTAQLAMSSERMPPPEGNPDELDTAPQEHILALDGLAVLVHPDNPIRTLSLEQIAALFAGRITNWSQLGGPDLPVTLYVRDDNSGAVSVFNALVMAPYRLEIAEAAERLADNAELSDLVSIDPGGIGFTSLAFVRAAKALAIRESCGLVSFPSGFAIKTEEYPLSYRLYAYSPKSGRSYHADEFLRFALSNAAQPLIAEAGFADRSFEREGMEVQGDRLAFSLTSPGEFSLPLFREMLTELKDAERLSLTFRFNPGSSTLEPRSQSEAERFAQLLVKGRFAGKEILLVGLTDSVGDFKRNRRLALRRAQSVADTLRSSVGAAALADVPILVQSYGELTPVGCNETDKGRDLNRRVEVWVRDRQH